MSKKSTEEKQRKYLLRLEIVKQEEAGRVREQTGSIYVYSEKHKAYVYFGSTLNTTAEELREFIKDQDEDDEDGEDDAEQSWDDFVSSRMDSD